MNEPLLYPIHCGEDRFDKDQAAFIHIGGWGGHKDRSWPISCFLATIGNRVHPAKIASGKYFLRKLRQGRIEPFYEKQIMKWIGAKKLKNAR